jgi:hypothetical protein
VNIRLESRLPDAGAVEFNDEVLESFIINRAAIDAASGPLKRTIPRPPHPGGVEMAAMVSGFDSGQPYAVDSVEAASNVASRLNRRQRRHSSKSPNSARPILPGTKRS